MELNTGTDHGCKYVNRHYETDVHQYSIVYVKKPLSQLTSGLEETAWN